MKIWAHRGCSQMYPENTIIAFKKAVEIPMLTGIELDIQLTKDGEIIVIHDERVDRTADGFGYVKDYTYKQIRKLTIDAGNGNKEKIPSMKEVLDLTQENLKHGLFLNIELKNSIISYNGLEEKILELIAERGLEKQIVYSSFYAKSLMKIRKLMSSARLGILDIKVSDCLYKKNGGCGADALHPYWRGLDLSKEQLCGQTVRAWLTGHLYPEKATGKKLELKLLENLGITDVFLNEPEEYLNVSEAIYDYT